MEGIPIVCMFCFSFIDRSMENNHHRHHLPATRGKKQNELRRGLIWKNASQIQFHQFYNLLRDVCYKKLPCT